MRHVLHLVLRPLVNPLPSSPRDWPQGAYLNLCSVCKEQFAGPKRSPTCKVCADEISEVAKMRGDWLHAHGAPADWTVHTVAEVQAMHAQVADQTWALLKERDLRRELALAFERLASVPAIAHLAGAHYPVMDGQEVVARSKALDAEIASRAADST